jgi:hypothetical protein
MFHNNRTGVYAMQIEGWEIVKYVAALEKRQKQPRKPALLASILKALSQLLRRAA